MDTHNTHLKSSETILAGKIEKATLPTPPVAPWHLATAAETSARTPTSWTLVQRDEGQDAKRS